MQPNKKTMAELVQDVFVEEEITEPVNDSFVSDDDKDQLRKILEKASDKQVEQILMKVDPRNKVDYFERQYKGWSRNPTKRNDKATLGSKLSFYLGSILITSPESIGMPDSIHYLVKDKFVVFPEHFNEKTINTYNVKKNIYYTNMFNLKFANSVSKICVIGLLAFGLFLSGTQTIVLGVEHGVNSVVSHFKSQTDLSKSKEVRLANLKADAQQLVDDHNNHKIDDAAFAQRVNELKETEKQINQ